MVNGPSRLGANFRLMIRHFRFRASSQTLSPLVKGLKPLRERELIVTRDVLQVDRAKLDCLEGGTHEEMLRPQVNPKVKCSEVQRS